MMGDWHCRVHLHSGSLLFRAPKGRSISARVMPVLTGTRPGSNPFAPGTHHSNLAQSPDCFSTYVVLFPKNRQKCNYLSEPIPTGRKAFRGILAFASSPPGLGGRHGVVEPALCGPASAAGALTG
jgi:hypothetical protein